MQTNIVGRALLARNSGEMRVFILHNIISTAINPIPQTGTTIRQSCPIQYTLTDKKLFS
jgi:hypothetical protein